MIDFIGFGSRKVLNNGKLTVKIYKWHKDVFLLGFTITYRNDCVTQTKAKEFL
jgi:hypothetical protein